ncbi:uncharacterized protein BO66DRAFT_406126 [Aspergillus aculeatinus CBS 121060]|uniref:Uncharacterized protein n=1 Tax=Aspergillus aculeatinus CBS 121060 TaxID=1448322 RepID=A0ACD1GU38_9EURO|nr:hypothetical protein BO66DRAFT_406126 [Aspergillus aculeatinus CBS 121060]RAH64780.1 hypothetical protein BO66DRAFT_406126 [Aspergillus aculeatinus CBS 121060]
MEPRTIRWGILAGGALLDRRIYSLTWLFQTLYTTQIPPSKTSSSELSPPAPRVVASLLQSTHPQGWGNPTVVNKTATVVLTFPRDVTKGGNMFGIATTSFREANDIDGQGTSGPAVLIQGSKGELQVWPPIFRPTRTRLILADSTVEDRSWPQPGPGRAGAWYNRYSVAGMGAEGEGYGMFWEAEEAAMAVVEGRRRVVCSGLNESVLIMQVMDEVRRQNGLVYPSGIEAAD